MISSAQWQQDKRSAAYKEHRRKIELIRQFTDQLVVQEECEKERRLYCDQIFREWLQEHNIYSTFRVADTPALQRHKGPDGGEEKLSSPDTTCGVPPRRKTRGKDGVMRWNYATKPPSESYVPALSDHYPRDQFTKLPSSPPRRRTVSHAMRIVMKRRADRSIDTLKPIPDNYEHLESISSKAVIFKPNNILDVDKQRRFDVDIGRLTEVPLHLGNDMSSPLFRNALLPGCRNQLVSEISLLKV